MDLWHRLLSPPSLFVCSFAADCIYLSPCLTAPADVAANLTCLAIIAQRAPRQGCWGGVGSHLSAQQRKYAGRQGARVASNVFVHDMDLAAFDALDGAQVGDRGRRSYTVARSPARN